MRFWTGESSFPNSRSNAGVVATRHRPLSRVTFRRRVWLPAVENAELRRNVRFHDLRGSHASCLLAGGADLNVVMDRLSHRQITSTQQYLGSLPDAGERALAAFEAVRHHRA